MRKWTSTNTATLTIDILLFERFSNHCFANALEPFRAANMLAGRNLYKWHLYTVTGQPVRSSSGIQLVPDQTLGSEQNADLLFVMSSYGHELHVNKQTSAALRSACARSKVVAGFDTGAWLLAANQQLDGRRATIHWDILDAFSERFLDVEVERKRFIIDQNRITCSGAMAAFDLALHLIGDHHGQALKMDVASLLMSSESIDTPIEYSAGKKSRLVTKAVTLMQEHLEQPIPIKTMARSLNCTQKELERAFKTAFGAAPIKVYRHMRLSAIKRFVETTNLPIAEIAVRGGYENTSSMTRAFKAEFGVKPSALRN